jgi:peptide/nickel transport system permease protein
MARYIARRLVLMVIVLAGMSVLTFLLTHLVPGNPAKLMAGLHATQAQVDVYTRRYGLNKPLPVQYWRYVTGLTHGDFGTSLTTQRPVAEDLKQFAPATAELVFAAMVLTVVIGVPLGALSGLFHRSWFDHSTRVISVAGAAMPAFWLGMILQVVFFAKLGVLPVGGQLDILSQSPPTITGMVVVDSLLAGQFTVFRDALLHLILPAFTLAAGGIAIVTRMSRGAMEDTLETDFIRMARAKGMPELRVVGRHALPNALTSTVTVLGLQVGALFAGTFLVESVFTWPGIGLYAVTGIRDQDYAAIMGVTLLIAVTYCLANLVVDVIYALMDPRITYAGT